MVEEVHDHVILLRTASKNERCVGAIDSRIIDTASAIFTKDLIEQGDITLGSGVSQQITRRNVQLRWPLFLEMKLLLFFPLFRKFFAPISNKQLIMSNYKNWKQTDITYQDFLRNSRISVSAREVWSSGVILSLS